MDLKVQLTRDHCKRRLINSSQTKNWQPRQKGRLGLQSCIKMMRGNYATMHQEIKAGRMGLLMSSSAVMDVCFYSYKQFNYGYNSNCLTCILMMVQDPFNEFPD